MTTAALAANRDEAKTGKKKSKGMALDVNDELNEATLTSIRRPLAIDILPQLSLTEDSEELVEIEGANISDSGF